jgi:hypothetical protein
MRRRLNPSFTIESLKRLAVYTDPKDRELIWMGCVRRDSRRLSLGGLVHMAGHLRKSAVKNLEFADFSMRRWRIPAVDFAGIHGL